MRPDKGRIPGQHARLPALLLAVLVAALVAAVPGPVRAHHTLGRPSYSLNEDSNTPSSMQGEVLIGDYTVTWMVFPAFPKPGRQGMINLYAKRTADGVPFDGEVTFTVTNNGWLTWLTGRGEPDRMGVQRLDDGVFRQPFVFRQKGDYLVSARFRVEGTPYIIDFPLRVGPPPAFGPLGLAAGAIFVLLVAVSLIQRRRAMTGRTRAVHEARKG